MLKPRYILCQYIAMPSGKSNKIPLNPNTLIAHNPLDSSIHMTYDAARALAAKLGNGYGIGFVFLKEDNYFFIDLDNCLDANGQWNETARNTLAYYPGAYAEVSHSGKGLHIIGKFEGVAPLIGKRLDSLGIEIYTANRFCALTGYNAIGDAETIHTDALHQYLRALNIDIAAAHERPDLWTTESEPGKNVPEDNDELIEFMLYRAPRSSNETFGGMIEFKHLWEGNVDVLSKFFPSNIPGKPYDFSAADAALAYRLHYYTGGNCERVMELMNLSALKRDKWEFHSRYLPMTIERARGSNREFFVHARQPQAYSNNITTVDGKQPEIGVRMLNVGNYPELSENLRKVLDTSRNLKTLLDVFGISVRWNSMRREREIIIPKYELFPEDAENHALSVLCDLAINNFMPITRIDQHLDLIAQMDCYHPIVEGLAKHPWDGRPRLRRFIDCLETSNPELTQKLVKRWMVSAIAAAHSKTGFSSQGVLVLAGAQNLGKTRFIKALDPFNCKAVKGGSILDPKDKDCVKTLAGFWIAELGELDATFRKADIARLKSFITEDYDKLRFAYARKDSSLLRKTTYAATVNDPHFLVDDTGNRRWWTIHVTAINNDHGLDMVQIWAEVYHLWVNGEQTWLTQEEMQGLSIHNKRHEMINPLEELFHQFFDFSEGWRSRPLKEFSATEVLRILGFQNPNRSQCTRMGIIISNATGKPPTRKTHCSIHHIRIKDYTV